MNKRILKLITCGALSICFLTTSQGVYALENGNTDIQNTFEIKDDSGNIVNSENITIKYELVDVEVENDKILIESGLLSENYKEEMILQYNTRGSMSTSVYFEHPVKYTVKAAGYDGIRKTFTADAVATMTANINKQLKVSMTLDNIKNVNGYITKKTTSSPGAYVSIGGTSTARQYISTTKNGSPIAILHNPEFKAKPTSYIPGNAQVGFGLGATLSW